MAGWYAKKMGLPIRKLVCASNRNRVLADFFSTGKYDIKRNFYRTMSPSMDVLVSTDLERLLFEVSGRNAKQIADRMQNLAERGEYSITLTEKGKIEKDIYGGYASEDDTVEAMYELFEEYGYPMDTHTGVGLAVYAEYAEKKDKKDFTSTVVLSTANPYKFPQDVLYALSGNDVKDCFKGIKRLNLLTAMKPPKALTDLRYRPLRFKKTYPCDLKKLTAAVLDFVDGNIIPVPDKK
jgi:threonine synthase